MANWTVEFEMQDSYGGWMPYQPQQGEGHGQFLLPDEAVDSGRRFRARCVGDPTASVVVVAGGQAIAIPPDGSWVPIT